VVDLFAFQNDTQHKYNNFLKKYEQLADLAAVQECYDYFLKVEVKQ